MSQLSLLNLLETCFSPAVSPREQVRREGKDMALWQGPPGTGVSPTMYVEPGRNGVRGEESLARCKTEAYSSDKGQKLRTERMTLTEALSSEVKIGRSQLVRGPFFSSQLSNLNESQRRRLSREPEHATQKRLGGQRQRERSGRSSRAKLLRRTSGPNGSPVPPVRHRCVYDSLHRLALST